MFERVLVFAGSAEQFKVWQSRQDGTNKNTCHYIACENDLLRLAHGRYKVVIIGSFRNRKDLDAALMIEIALTRGFKVVEESMDKSVFEKDFCGKVSPALKAAYEAHLKANKQKETHLIRARGAWRTAQTALRQKDRKQYNFHMRMYGIRMLTYAEFVYNEQNA